MELQNKDIRFAIAEAGIKQWQVAEVYGLHEGNFSRLLRKELDITDKKRILMIIDKLKGADEWKTCV